MARLNRTALVKSQTMLGLALIAMRLDTTSPTVPTRTTHQQYPLSPTPLMDQDLQCLESTVVSLATIATPTIIAR